MKFPLHWVVFIILINPFEKKVYLTSVWLNTFLLLTFISLSHQITVLQTFTYAVEFSYYKIEFAIG